MIIFSILSSLVFAQTLAGVTLPDTISSNSETLQLNGMGLREKYWIDIYVAGLYLPKKMSNPRAIISLEQPKRIHAKFIYSDVPKTKMIATLEENIANNTNFTETAVKQIRQAEEWMEDFTTGDEMIFDYVPNKGTTIYVKGKEKGTIAGVDFMHAIFEIYVGDHPASEQLKTGLLGQ